MACYRLDGQASNSGQAVIPSEWYWAIFTVIAAAAQTLRNAAQRQVTGAAGVFGATLVRFLYGLPFAVLFFAAIVSVHGLPPEPDAAFWAWTVFGAVLQIVATGLLLAAMNERNFAVAIAYSRTEPVQIAIFGLIVLGDPLTLLLAVAILAATLGVLCLSWPKSGMKLETRPVVLGILAGSAFAMSAIGFRAAVQELDAPFTLAATTMLLTALIIQSILMTGFMLWRDRTGLSAVASAWKISLMAGAAGATATQLWFFAFALESAARVRTLGVIEILFAQIVSARLLREGATARELIGIALVIVGVVVVLNA
ncbi:DMT transporter permease [Terrihabitans soli]|uniref:DMT transporter permease n=1 Tax=Terrihabitans soli TaxID=708113 RepID=A0A6S6QMJ5_9HYPH|nr:EamA family transporter [Terrihabitans soli]BCJ90159.1 DMT transporter permease [Terrihabitans soli]